LQKFYNNSSDDSFDFVSVKLALNNYFFKPKEVNSDIKVN